MEKITDKARRLDTLISTEIMSGLYPLMARLPSERELGERYGVSRVTARKALIALTEAGVLSCRGTVGYFVTPDAVRILAAEKRHAAGALKVGVILTPKRYTNALLEDFFRALAAYCAPEIQLVPFFHSYPRPALYRREKLAAVIIDAAYEDSDITAIAAEGIETIVFNRESKRFNFVTVDNYRAGHMMIEHLARKGHRRALYPTLSYLPSTDEFAERYRGATAAAEEFGLTLNAPKLSQYADIFHPGQFAAFFTETPRTVTAVAAFQSLLAINFIEFLEDQNLRVPDDISVIGMDERAFNASVSPPLTTTRHPIEAMARDIADCLKAFASGKKISAREKYAPILIERESVKDISK